MRSFYDIPAMQQNVLVELKFCHLNVPHLEATLTSLTLFFAIPAFHLMAAKLHKMTSLANLPWNSQLLFYVCPPT